MSLPNHHVRFMMKDGIDTYGVTVEQSGYESVRNYKFCC